MGAHSLETKWDYAADIAACSAMLRGGSRTFFAASKVLPRRISEPATALYAFCRVSDDTVDTNDRDAAAVKRLRARLDRAYTAEPLPSPADRAFAETVRRFAIPRALPLALLEGLAWDTEGRRYEDLDGLIGYAVRVAGSVGMMMSILMGARARPLLARACDLGVAMQLTNIARDIGEDARAGRVYLPLQWLRAVGVDPDAWLKRPRFCSGIGIAVRQLLEEADRLYSRSRAGIDHLPLGCQAGIHAARLLYREIGQEIRRSGYDGVSRRAVVPPWRKGLLLAGAVLSLALSTDDCAAEALTQAQYLLASVPDVPDPMPRSRSILGTLEERAVWMLDLFEQLERRQQPSRINP